MKKTVLKSLLTGIVLACLAGSVTAQDMALASDRAPVRAGIQHAVTPSANARIANMWDVLFNDTINAPITAGQSFFTGICYVGNEFWISRFISDTLCIFDSTGTYTAMRRITGVSAIRSMTFNPTANLIYAAVNTNSIKKITPISSAPTLAGTINVPNLTGGVSAYTTTRWATYDRNANGGAGGLWIGNYDTDIFLVSLTGTTLYTIPATNHGMVGMYGAAYDDYSAGGPYLWVHDQTGSQQDIVVQLNTGSGLQTGVLHDVNTDVGLASSGGIAGGTFLYPKPNGPLTLYGVLQGTPDLLFGYDMDYLVGLGQQPSNGNFLSVLPSISSDMIDVKLDKQNNNEASIRIYDAQGRLVWDRTSKGINNYINVSSYSNGLYLVKVIYGNESYTTRFVKN